MTTRKPSSAAGYWLASDVADVLRAEIRHGRLRTGSPISEAETQKTFAVSHTLARRALSALATDRLIVRTRGHGSAVSADQIALPLDDLTSDSGQVVLIEELSRSIVTVSRVVREAIGIDGDEVGMIEHLYLVGAVPIGIRIAYFAADTPQVRRTGPTPDIVRAFFETFAAPLVRVDSTVEAIACDERTAEILRIERGAPLLMREQRLVDASGLTREINFAQYRADMVTFVD